MGMQGQSDSEQKKLTQDQQGKQALAKTGRIGMGCLQCNGGKGLPGCRKCWSSWWHDLESVSIDVILCCGLGLGSSERAGRGVGGQAVLLVKCGQNVYRCLPAWKRVNGHCNLKQLLMLWSAKRDQKTGGSFCFKQLRSGSQWSLKPETAFHA